MINPPRESTFEKKWRFMDKIICDPAWNDTERRVAYRLLDYFHVQNDHGWTFHKILADQLGVERETVSRVMKRLNDKGLFQIRSPHGPRGKKVFKPNWSFYVTDGSRKAGANVTGEGVLCDRSTPDNVTGGSRHTLDIHIKNTRPLDLEFERFFDVRGLEGRVCKKAARALFDRLVNEGITPQDLRQGTMRFMFDALPKPQDLAKAS